MSELKVRFIDDTYVEYYNTGKHDLAQVYLKSEADKVIADLEESHKMEVEQLLMEIVKLKEERRWRKFPDEKPEEDTWCIVFHDGEIDSDHYTRFAFNNKCDFALYGNEVTHWMPLPSAPKEGK